MPDPRFSEVLEEICRKDPRYYPDAYQFVCESLRYTSKLLDKPADGPERHVSGAELLEGFRSYALQEYGPMAHSVLRTWGIAQTADIGDIVFNMVEMEVFGKTDADSCEDFKHGYNFHEAFVAPFLPAATK